MASSPEIRKRFEGKVAVTSGSTYGIGLSIAERLLDEGCSVVVSSRKQESVDEAVAYLSSRGHAAKARGVVCHINDPEHRKRLLQKAIDEFGGFDILILNAAVNRAFGDPLKCTEDQWTKIFHVNLKAPFFFVKEAVPHLEKRGGGSILVTSTQSAWDPGIYVGVYATSKLALVGLVKALSWQLSEKNIRINCIAPGLFKTKFGEILWAREETAKEEVSYMPMRRFGEPHECSGAAAFLCSEDASYISGESLVIAGGKFSRL